MCLIAWGSNCKFWEKNPQVHLVIIREWPKNNSHILRNFDNFLLGAYYSTPATPSPPTSPPHRLTLTFRHKRVQNFQPTLKCISWVTIIVQRRVIVFHCNNFTTYNDKCSVNAFIRLFPWNYILQIKDTFKRLGFVN